MVWSVRRLLLAGASIGGLGACASGGGGPAAVTTPTGTISDPQPTLTRAADWQTPEYRNQQGLDAIGAAEAYASLTRQGKAVGGEGVRIAIVDSGIDSRHPDIEGAVTWRSVIDGRNPEIDDHATVIAGIAAGRRNGGSGETNAMHGVAFNATLADIKVSFGGGASGTDIFYEAQAVAAGIASAAGVDREYAGSRRFSSDPRASSDIINISLGGGAASTTLSVLDAMRLAAQNDRIMVLAAGNGGHAQPDYPAMYAMDDTVAGLGIVAVAAEQRDDGSWGLAADSNRCGATMDFCLMAPGIDIYAPLTDDRYGLASGTSMAAPHVSGAAAVVMAAFPGVPPRDVVSRLFLTAENAAEGPNAQTGWGMVDLAAAVAPVGQQSVPLGDQIGGGIPVAPGMGVPPALGRALPGGSTPTRVLTLDSMGFPFTLDLSAADDGRDLWHLEARLQHREPTTTDLPVGARSHHLVAGITPPNAAASPDFAAQQFLPAGAHSHHLSMVLPLSGTGQLALTQYVGHHQAEAASLFQPGEDRASRMTHAQEARLSLGSEELHWRFAVGHVEEGAGLAGTRGNLPGRDLSSRSAFAGLAATRKWEEDVAVTGHATLTTTTLGSTELTSSGHLVMASFGGHVTAADMWGYGDRLRLGVEMPMTAIRGQIDTRIPVARTEKGEIIREAEALALGAATPIVWNADYQRPVTQQLDLSVSAWSGHSQNAKDAGLAARLSTRF